MNEQDNYSEEELKYIRLLLDEAFDDIRNGRIYSLEEAMQFLGKTDSSEENS